MSDPRTEFTFTQACKIGAALIVLGMGACFFYGCATCPPPKPCPAPEIVTVDRIVPAPCPVPPEVIPMTPLIEHADCETAPPEECVRILLSLLGDMIRERDEYRDIVRAYAMGPTLPPGPEPTPTPP